MPTCGCHCIKCGGTSMSTHIINNQHPDGQVDIHHTCLDCNTHFDHLERDIFKVCSECNYKP